MEFNVPKTDMLIDLQPHHFHRVWLGPAPMPAIDPRTRALLSSWEEYLWYEGTTYQLGLKPEDYDHGTYAGSSNIIRLHAVYQKGGVYGDHDVHLLRRIDELSAYPAWVCRQPDGVLCNAIFGARAGHPWVKAMIEALHDYRQYDAAHACHIIEGCLTPDVVVLESPAFYSWNWDEPPRDPLPGAFGVHTWEGSWVANKQKAQ